MEYLTFNLVEVAEGVCALEAMASTAVEQHAAVMAEVQAVLDWAWRQHPSSHGPVDDGLDWDHDLQVVSEVGGWYTVTLTLAATGRFVDDFLTQFGSAVG
jgi:hypothetical protein